MSKLSRIGNLELKKDALDKMECARPLGMVGRGMVLRGVAAWRGVACYGVEWNDVK